MISHGLEVSIVSKEDWVRSFSEASHLVCFGKHKPSSFDRIDYAMLMADPETKTPRAYITAREFDHETVYWQFGGSFPGTKGTVASLACFEAALEHAKLHYKRVTFVVENTNFPMLKLAQKKGFVIVGLRNFNGTVLLEHMLEFQKGD